MRLFTVHVCHIGTVIEFMRQYYNLSTIGECKMWKKTNFSGDYVLLNDLDVTLYEAGLVRFTSLVGIM